MLGPHTHTPAPTACGWRTPTARPVGGQSGEGQRLTSDAPHNGGRHLPRGRPSATPKRTTPARKGARCGVGAGSPRLHRPHPGHTGRGTLAARSRGRAAGGGTAPDTRRPSQWWKAPPPGTPFRQPHSEQRQPARAHAVGPVLGPHARTDRTRNTRVAEPRLPAPEDGRPGEGQRLTPDASHNSGRPAPPGDGPQPAPRHAAPTGHAGQGDSVGPPHSHTRAKGKGHPDGTARHTQRGTRGAGRGKRERHNTRYRPEPPEPAASAARTQTGHCIRQGSSGAQRHAPTPRLGSLRASPRGSHWRQASSTGPAAPAPRATTHHMQQCRRRALIV